MERERWKDLNKNCPIPGIPGLCMPIAAILFVFVGSRLARLGMPTGLYIMCPRSDNRASPIVLARMKRLR